jgi:hypothetical protein
VLCLHLGVLFIEDRLHLRFLPIRQIEQNGQVIHALRWALVPKSRARSAATGCVGRLGGGDSHPQDSHCD